MNLLTIALNNVRRRKSRVFFLLLGLIVSAGTALTLVALGKGMSEDITRRLDEYGANILVLPTSEGLTLSYGGVTVQDAGGTAPVIREEQLETLRGIRNAENISVVAPKVVGRSTIEGTAVLVAGVRFDDEFRLKQWWSLARGHRSKASHDVVVGADVARRLELSPGRRVLLGNATVTVAGVLEQTGDQDDGLVFSELRFAQDLIGAPGAVSMVEIAALCTGCPIGDMVEQISGAMPGTTVKAMKETLDLKMKAVQQFHMFSYAVSGVIALVAGLIVFINMMASVGERKREIGIFRAIGYRRGHIMSIVCSEAFIMGLAGGVMGALFGSLLPRYLAPFVVQTQALKLGFDPALGAVAVLCTALISTLASLYPAISAARLDPMVALREL